MRKIDIGKAIPAIDPVEDVQIHIGPGECPELYKEDHQLQIDYYLSCGRTLEEALHASLPGGTYDALLGHMMARKASMLRVSFNDPRIKGSES